MEMLGRYQYEDLSDTVLKRRGFGNWKWLMPMLREEGIRDTLERERDLHAEMEEEVANLNTLKANMEAESKVLVGAALCIS